MIRRVIFLAALLAVMDLAGLIGCHASSARPSETAESNPWTQPGILRIGGQPEPDNLNPLFGTQVIDTDISMFWASYLFYWNDRNEFVPELATKLPTLANGGISKDGLTIVYHLRRGVKWQDGAPFTAADVVYTWRQVLNPKNDIQSRLGYELITRIDTPDKYTLVIHLKQRYAPLVATFFTMSSTTFCILPQHLLAKSPDLNNVAYNDLPIGTGPFKIVSYVKGKSIRMVANPSYWRGPPQLKEVQYHIIADDRQLLRKIREHEIDFYYNASQAQEPQLHGIAGTTIYLYPFTRFADIGFNAGTPLLRDLRVRHALAYGTDRRELITNVAHGVNLPADSDQPPFSWAHAEHLRAYHYDPALSRRLLERSGWRLGSDGVRHKDGKSLTLVMVGFSGSSTTAAAQRVIRDEWAQVGARVVIKNYPSEKLYGSKAAGGIEQSGKFDVAFEEWANGVDPEDSQLFMCSMRPPGGWNIYHLCDRALDRAELTALSEYDLTKRKAAYTKVQQILVDQLPVLVLWFAQRQDVVNLDLVNYRPAYAVTPFWNTWQWEI
ncbi:MAG: hypothetical protein DLM53_00550 [Candidatus Eremiobacter antarcticus]|nr:MAG: hypothetical protein DLM53_00550 [Candidatus Eremiobacter sp. RRmetagenome_bin22]